MRLRRAEGSSARTSNGTCDLQRGLCGPKRVLKKWGRALMLIPLDFHGNRAGASGASPSIYSVPLTRNVFESCAYGSHLRQACQNRYCTIRQSNLNPIRLSISAA